jgi:hypothetical protein
MPTTAQRLKLKNKQLQCGGNPTHIVPKNKDSGGVLAAANRLEVIEQESEEDDSSSNN